MASACSDEGLKVSQMGLFMFLASRIVDSEGVVAFGSQFFNYLEDIEYVACELSFFT